MHLRRIITGFCGTLAVVLPLSASAATLTATQQGLVSSSTPLGAQRALFLEVSLQASCDGPVTVRSFDVRHRGLGNATDLERVYITDNNTRLSHTHSLSSSRDPVTVRFYPSLVIPACGIAMVQLRGDFSPTAEVAGEHGLIVDGIDAADATVMLSALTSAQVLTTKPVSVGSVHAVMLGLTRQPRYGVASTLARVRLEADGYTDHEVRAITFVNKGKARDSDIQHLRIQTKRGDALTATVATLDAKRVRLVFNTPLFLERNTDVMLELVGEVRASRSRTIALIVEEPSDVEAVSPAR